MASSTPAAEDTGLDHALMMVAWVVVLGALATPIAGRLTDRTGVGRIVPVGLILVAISFLGLTQLEADTS